MPLVASTRPVLVRCRQLRPSTGPVLVHDGMFMGRVPSRSARLGGSGAAVRTLGSVGSQRQRDRVLKCSEHDFLYKERVVHEFVIGSFRKGLFKYINTPLGGGLAWRMILYKPCLKQGNELCMNGGGGAENPQNSVLMYLNSP